MRPPEMVRTPAREAIKAALPEPHRGGTRKQLGRSVERSSRKKLHN